MNHIQRLQELNQTFDKVLDACSELVFIGEPVLRQKTAEVSVEEGIELGEKLKITLGRYRGIAGFGRGLAAPQIGESKAVFITYVDDVFKTYINPKIIQESSETNFYRETCLSCGFMSVDIQRPASIVFEYTDEDGITQKEELDSFSARLIQHEYDHLEGIVNVDKAEPSSINFMFDDPLKEELRDLK